MKKLILILTVVVMTAVVFNGCKKDNTVQPTKQEVTAKDKAITEKVLEFKNKLMWYKENPNAKDGQTLSVNDAVWNTEALLNYTYDEGGSMNNLTNITDSVEVTSTNGQINYVDLYGAYSQMEALITGQLNENPNTDLVFADVSNLGEIDGKTTLVVTAGISEAASVPPPALIPFRDAAGIIANNINATVSVPTGGYYYTNITLVTVQYNLYYIDNGAWINHSFINQNDPNPGDNWYDYRLFYNYYGWQPSIQNFHTSLNSDEMSFYTGRAGGIVQEMFSLVPQIQSKGFIGMTAEGEQVSYVPDWWVFHRYYLNYGNVVLTGGGGNGD